VEFDTGATELEPTPEQYEFSDPEGFDEGAGSSLVPPELDFEE
jgi:hypothetical protein